MPDSASHQEQNTHKMITRSKAGVFKPKRPFVGLTTVSPSTPCNVKQALLDPAWRQAMLKNIMLLLWDFYRNLVSRTTPPGSCKNPITTGHANIRIISMEFIIIKF